MRKNKKFLSDHNHIDIAIDRIKAFEKKALSLNPDGYYLAFSGGKDSITVEFLMRMAKVKFTAHYNVTTVDHPALMAFIKKNYPTVEFSIPEISMWNLIPLKLMPPTRKAKYCCEHLKHRNGEGRFVVTGIRAAESNRRMSNRHIAEFPKKKEKENNEPVSKMVEYCQPKGKWVLNPIIDWTDGEVWEFIHDYRIPYCKLYDEGYTRLGCIGCPESGKRTQLKEFKMYPTIRSKWIKAFEDMIEERKKRGKDTDWINGEDVMGWWLQTSRIDIQESPMYSAIMPGRIEEKS